MGHVVYTRDEITELLDFFTSGDSFAQKKRFEEAADIDIYEAVFCNPEALKKIYNVEDSELCKNKDHPFFNVKKELVAIESKSKENDWNKLPMDHFIRYQSLKLSITDALSRMVANQTSTEE